MIALQSPMVLYNCAVERPYLIHNRIRRPMFQNYGLTPHEVTLGAPGDISNLCLYGWYEWTYYHNHGALPGIIDK